MKNSPNVNKTRISQRPRLRFGLKTLFVVVTGLCLALGVYMERQRWSTVVEAWDKELRNVICDNLANIPRHTRSIDPPDVIAAPSPTADFVPQGLPRLAADDASQPLTYWSPTVNLDVTHALRTESPAALAERLLKHYESGLDRHAMARKSIQLCSFGPQSSAPSAVWFSERPEFGAMVTIDVRVEEPTHTATIQIRHIARPNLGLW